MYALISDIHGNLEALEAIFEHIDGQGIEDIFCLGDVVGYGPDPEACVDLVRDRCRWCLSGNHDYAVLTQALGFNPVAKQSINCIRERMKPRYFAMSKKAERWRFLEELLLSRQEGDVLFVHGSPRDERNEYITMHDVAFGPTGKMVEIFSLVPRLLFVGHTHRPGAITADCEWITPPDVDYQLDVSDGAQYIINVSSVGQPRDRDSRTCYATVDGDVITWHRLEYDYEATMAKIIELACVDRVCADRLALGM